jgi:prepilin peptidase CpaA
LHWAAAAAYPLALAYAVVSDVRRLKIPNRASTVIAAAFLPAAAGAGLEPSAIAVHYAVGGGLLGAGFIAFSRNLMGGGDVKLLAAAGIWSGWAQLGPYLVLVAVLGGVLAAAVLIAHKLRKASPFLDALGQPIPYGVAIGGAAIYLFTENPALPEAWARLLS